jgi:hypothetical protein
MRKPGQRVTGLRGGYGVELALVASGFTLGHRLLFCGDER